MISNPQLHCFYKGILSPTLSSPNNIKNHKNSFKMKGISVILAVSMLVIAASYATEAAVSCTDVQKNLQPCIGHLKSQDSQATPPANCCGGVKSVKALADSTGERKAVCQCMKDMATTVSGINYDLAAKLPTQCGVTMSYTISPNTDCSKV